MTEQVKDQMAFENTKSPSLYEVFYKRRMTHQSPCLTVKPVVGYDDQTSSVFLMLCRPV